MLSSYAAFVEDKVPYYRRIWHDRQAQSPWMLARDGFYGISLHDAYVCAYCHKVDLSISSYKHPLRYHLKNNPRCIELRKTDQNLRKPPVPTMIGLQPFHSLQRNPERRRLTFLGAWPKQLNQSIGDLVRAGFFYEGRNDTVSCFHCGIKVNRWKRHDVPLLEHIRWSPSCLLAIALLTDWRVRGDLPAFDAPDSATPKVLAKTDVSDVDFRKQWTEQLKRVIHSLPAPKSCANVDDQQEHASQWRESPSWAQPAHDTCGRPFTALCPSSASSNTDEVDGRKEDIESVAEDTPPRSPAPVPNPTPSSDEKFLAKRPLISETTPPRSSRPPPFKMPSRVEQLMAKRPVMFKKAEEAGYSPELIKQAAEMFLYYPIDNLPKELDYYLLHNLIEVIQADARGFERVQQWCPRCNAKTTHENGAVDRILEDGTRWITTVVYHRPDHANFFECLECDLQSLLCNQEVVPDSRQVIPDC